MVTAEPRWVQAKRALPEALAALLEEFSIDFHEGLEMPTLADLSQMFNPARPRTPAMGQSLMNQPGFGVHPNAIGGGFNPGVPSTLANEGQAASAAQNALIGPAMSAAPPASPSAGYSATRMPDGGLRAGSNAPPGTPYSADPNMGGAGPYTANNLPSTPLSGAAPSLSQDAQNAGYTSIARPNGYASHREGGFRTMEQAQANAARGWNHMAPQSSHDAGYSQSPSFQGGGWANPGPLAAGNMANRLPPQAQGPMTSFDQVMALRQGQSINPATGRPWGQD